MLVELLKGAKGPDLRRMGKELPRQRGADVVALRQEGLTFEWPV